MEDGVPVRKLAVEKMPNQEKVPLAAAPELVKNGIHYLHKIESGGEASFCYRKIGYNIISDFIVSLSNTAYSGTGTLYYNLAAII